MSNHFLLFQFLRSFLLLSVFFFVGCDLEEENQDVTLSGTLALSEVTAPQTLSLSLFSLGKGVVRTVQLSNSAGKYPFQIQAQADSLPRTLLSVDGDVQMGVTIGVLPSAQDLYDAGVLDFHAMALATRYLENTTRWFSFRNQDISQVLPVLHSLGAVMSAKEDASSLIANLDKLGVDSTGEFTISQRQWPELYLHPDREAQDWESRFWLGLENKGIQVPSQKLDSLDPSLSHLAAYNNLIKSARLYRSGQYFDIMQAGIKYQNASQIPLLDAGSASVEIQIVFNAPLSSSEQDIFASQILLEASQWQRNSSLQKGAVALSYFVSSSSSTSLTLKLQKPASTISGLPVHYTIQRTLTDLGFSSFFAQLMFSLNWQ